jgi:probable F420-dependent oxidoreductase
MKFGVSTFMTDEGLQPAELARALEERGLDSLFVAEHTHIPVSEQPPDPSGDLPARDYYRAIDPFVALAAAAAVTERLLVGTGIALVVQRDPIALAKETASLDHLSQGRFQLGVGLGWNRQEMRNHGTDPKTRMALLRERVLAVKEIWTSEQAEFHGEFVDFEPIFSWPKPVQRPQPRSWSAATAPPSSTGCSSMATDGRRTSSAPRRTCWRRWPICSDGPPNAGGGRSR